MSISLVTASGCTKQNLTNIREILALGTSFQKERISLKTQAPHCARYTSLTFKNVWQGPERSPAHVWLLLGRDRAECGATPSSLCWHARLVFCLGASPHPTPTLQHGALPPTAERSDLM